MNEVRNNALLATSFIGLAHEYHPHPLVDKITAATEDNQRLLEEALFAATERRRLLQERVNTLKSILHEKKASHIEAIHGVQIESEGTKQKLAALSMQLVNKEGEVAEERTRRKAEFSAHLQVRDVIILEKIRTVVDPMFIRGNMVISKYQTAIQSPCPHSIEIRYDHPLPSQILPARMLKLSPLLGEILPNLVEILPVSDIPPVGASRPKRGVRDGIPYFYYDQWNSKNWPVCNQLPFEPGCWIHKKAIIENKGLNYLQLCGRNHTDRLIWMHVILSSKFLLAEMSTILGFSDLANQEKEKVEAFYRAYGNDRPW